MPKTLSEDLVRKVPILRSDQTVGEAARTIVEQELPALPVVEKDGRYCGIFGEREFVTAVFPGYLGELKYAAFVPHSLDDDIEKRSACLVEPVGRYCNSEHVDVDEDYSDASLAETFLHHRVLIVPIVDSDRQVKGIVTHTDFFAALVERLSAAQ
jgi:CBS domain-containing protein